MSDDPAGVLAVVCTTVCLQLIGGFCLDFASITHTCTSRLCSWPSGYGADDNVEDEDPGERDLLIPKSQTQGGTTEAAVQRIQPPQHPTMSQSQSPP